VSAGRLGSWRSWRWFLLWVSCLLALWLAAWILHEAVFVPRGWAVASWSAGLYWTVAKLAVWIAPAVWILRRAGEGIGAATGLGTTRGLGWGLLLALAWLGVQVVSSKIRGAWPSPARSIASYAALNAYVISPLFEEFVFRGFALRTLRRRGVGFWPAALATAAAFSLIHVPGWVFMHGAGAVALAPLASVLLFGVVAAAVSWRIPSLWACSAVHLANNAWSEGLIVALTRSLPVLG